MEDHEVRREESGRKKRGNREEGEQRRGESISRGGRALARRERSQRSTVSWWKSVSVLGFVVEIASG
jgi:hypothetical protein